MPNDAIYPSLKDRVVLVTGGAMGIGEAIVRGFAAQGARIGFLDIADAAAGKLQADLGGQGTLHYEHCDVTDIAALQRAIEKVRKALGPITILINNAAHDERQRSMRSRRNSSTTASPSISSISSSPRRRSIRT